MRRSSISFFFRALSYLTLRVFYGWAILNIVHSAHAHRPNESSLQLLWEHGRLECQFTTSLQIATAILGDPEIPGIGSDNFPALRERLAALVATAFTVEMAGQPVKPAEVFVTLAPEGELSCAILFAPSPPAALGIRAQFLERCPSGTFCWARLWQDADRLSAQKLLTRSAPQAAFAVPSPDATPAAASPASTTLEANSAPAKPATPAAR